MTRRALFLDRDGVLDALVYYESSGEWEAPRTAGELRILPGVPEALRAAHDAGWTLCVVTNQPSYAKGKVSKESLLAVHEEFLRVAGAPIAKSGLCFHHPEASLPELRVRCDCRKPGARFLREAAEELGIDLAASWMVGDQDSDLGAGRAAGCRVALIETPESANKRGRIEPDLRCRDFPDFVSRVVNSAT
jgi:D-glycero-D-manno-heptose 1,7-bisphosphate phosphatase